jgi:hypothetical protein
MFLYSCLYLAQKFVHPNDYTTSPIVSNLILSPLQILARHCVCLCDDDNDIDMALACRHAYLPALSSQSMETLVQTRPDHFTPTFSSDGTVSHTKATEAALQLVLNAIQR